MTQHEIEVVIAERALAVAALRDLERHHEQRYRRIGRSGTDSYTLVVIRRALDLIKDDHASQDRGIARPGAV